MKEKMPRESTKKSHGCSQLCQNVNSPYAFARPSSLHEQDRDSEPENNNINIDAIGHIEINLACLLCRELSFMDIILEKYLVQLTASISTL